MRVMIVMGGGEAGGLLYLTFRHALACRVKNRLCHFFFFFLEKAFIEYLQSIYTV
jgi:hypothetical protein